MNIHITLIPNSEQRETVSGADWIFDDAGDLQVRISPMSDWRMETMLGIHEAIEAILCKHGGVSQKSVDDFDEEFYKTHECDVDAGDDLGAPYKYQHCIATSVERMLCAELGVNWQTYDNELRELYPNPLEKK